MTYVNGGWTPAEEEDDDQDLIGGNPTGRKRKSSATWPVEASTGASKLPRTSTVLFFSLADLKYFIIL